MEIGKDISNAWQEVKVYRIQDQGRRRVNKCKSPSWLVQLDQFKPLQILNQSSVEQKCNPLFINKIKLNKWDFGLLSCLLCWNFKPWSFFQTNWSHVLTHTGHFMVGLAWKSQRLIRCLLAVLGSQRVSSSLIWSGRHHSNKTRAIMKLVLAKL